MTTHTPPTSVAVVPGSRTARRPAAGLHRRLRRRGRARFAMAPRGRHEARRPGLGRRHWTGAPTLAVDLGPKAVVDDLVYVGSVWDGELRLTAKTKKLEDRPVFKTQLGDDPRIKKPEDGEKPPALEGFDGGDKNFVLAGIAARDGVIVCSMIRQNEVLLFDAKKGRSLGAVPVANPRGVAFDAKGRLLVLSGKPPWASPTDSAARLLRLPQGEIHGYTPGRSYKDEVVISEGLEDPRQVTIGCRGQLPHHRSRPVASSETLLAGRQAAPRDRPRWRAGGRHVRAEAHEQSERPRGRFARPALGRRGGQLSAPRLRLERMKGELERAFYGPTEYGGGGVLDPQDKTRFFYKGMEFKLDWEKGHRPARARLLAARSAAGGAWRALLAGYAAVSVTASAKEQSVLHQLLYAQSDWRRSCRLPLAGMTARRPISRQPWAMRGPGRCS